MNPVSQQRPNKRLYTLKEGAIYLGLGIWAVRKRIWKGEIPFVRASKRRVLLDIRDMDSWIESNKERFSD